MRARTGTLLIKEPTMRSTSSSCGGRPETVSPNMTSRLPVSTDTTSATTPLSSVAVVRPMRRACALTAAAVSPLTVRTTLD